MATPKQVNPGEEPVVVVVVVVVFFFFFVFLCFLGKMVVFRTFMNVLCMVRSKTPPKDAEIGRNSPVEASRA